MAGFFEAISKISGTVYDIGAGSGILTICAAAYADFVYSVEIDHSISKKTREVLKDYKNVSFLNKDARKINFPVKADYIICEMLDTALIDEEQIPVLNHLIKFLKEDGKVIPFGIINGLEPVSTNVEHIFYQELENPEVEKLGPLNIYSKYHFGRYIEPKAEFQLKLEINRGGTLSGVKLTTFTLITPEIICGPTPMMNPPLIIPLEKLKVNTGDTVLLCLSYKMGGGLDTIKTRIKGITKKPE